MDQLIEIKKVGVLGAGAVGASIASMIIEASGVSTNTAAALIADGERAARLGRDGISVNSKKYHPAVKDRGPFDLIIVATKSFGLRDALPLLQRAAGSNTLMMSLLNGISSEAILADALPNGARRVIPAMIVGIDALRDASGVRYLNRGTIHFGSDPASFPVPEESILAVGRFLSGAGIPFVVSDDIRRTLWWKFMVNVGINQVSAVVRGDYGLFQRSSDAMELMRMAMSEVVELSKLEKTGLNDADIEEWVRTLMGLDPEGKTSMLQDVEAGRQTEADLFAGTVLELAGKHGVRVPVNRFLLHMLKVIESCF